MKITVKQLRKIIREVLENVEEDNVPNDLTDGDLTDGKYARGQLTESLVKIVDDLLKTIYKIAGIEAVDRVYKKFMDEIGLLSAASTPSLYRLPSNVDIEKLNQDALKALIALYNDSVRYFSREGFEEPETMAVAGIQEFYNEFLEKIESFNQNG